MHGATIKMIASLFTQDEGRRSRQGGAVITTMFNIWLFLVKSHRCFSASLESFFTNVIWSSPCYHHIITFKFHNTFVHCVSYDYHSLQLGLQNFYLSVRFFLTSVTVFRKPNAIPLRFSIDVVLNFLLSRLLVLLPSTFFFDVLFFFSPVVPIP